MNMLIEIGMMFYKLTLIALVSWAIVNAGCYFWSMSAEWRSQRMMNKLVKESNKDYESKNKSNI